MELVGRPARDMGEPRRINHPKRRLQALGAIGEFKPIHDARHDDVGEQQVEFHVLHEDLQRHLGIGHLQH